ncbi:MAG: DUF2789 domain-containing protein [Acidovorax sp.]|uniref:DUF2789 domain-containing protein n=1 Tax=Acidovorax sp. TaxID=1872122 RepID=UPI0039E24A79
MITTEPTMTNLFLQLGLDAGEQDIARFIKTHQIDTAVALGDAPFWTDAQRQFLSEQLKADAHWAVIVDQLGEALHYDAVQRDAAR